MRRREFMKGLAAITLIPALPASLPPIGPSDFDRGRKVLYAQIDADLIELGGGEEFVQRELLRLKEEFPDTDITIMAVRYRDDGIVASWRVA